MKTPPRGSLNNQRPRLGFLGLGWIGKNRMEAIAESGVAQIAALADPASEVIDQVRMMAPAAQACASLDDLLDLDLDGIVIATPSALHADQASKALAAGKAVFCQKPLGRSAEENREVIQAAQRADRLLGVDLSYRWLSGARKIHELCLSGQLGEIYAADLVFHNAYGPGKEWFYDWKQSGGGCVIDLGIHLADLALWNLGFPEIRGVSSRLFSQGRPIHGRSTVEDYAEAQLETESGAVLRLACSWKLSAGREAIIQANFYGTQGGASLHNVNGSFYEFAAEHFSGTKSEVLSSGPEPWGGRAAVHWAEQLAISPGFDPDCEHLEEVAATLDAIYDQSTAIEVPRVSPATSRHPALLSSL